MKCLFTILLSILFISQSFAEVIIITPNNKTNNIEVNLKVRKKQIVTFTIINQYGDIVNTIPVQVKKGKNKIDITNSSNLDEGTYTITMVTNRETTNTKFIIWK